MQVIGNLLEYMCAKNYLNRERFHKDVAKIKLCSFLPHILQAYTVCAAAGVIGTIWTGCDVVGVTSVDGKLFVLLQHRVNSQVAVYSINDYQLLRHLNVPEYKPDRCNDMTSCARYKCLYMSDNDNSCIHRYELASNATSKWSVPGQPRRLSVTHSCNLLVICQEANKPTLVELSADNGQSLREIELQWDTDRPRHSVQLTTGQHVVCYGYGRLHQVCVVSDDGTVTHSYGGECGSDVGQLNVPCHMAVDNDSQLIFVADKWNHRVVLLSPTLEFVRYFSERLSQPRRLYFHQATRRLFVGQVSGDVAVIQL